VTRKGRSITLSLEESDKAQLEAIALEFGMTWGDDPNVSRLIKAIARRQLLVLSNTDWSRDRIHALNRARTALVDIGEIEMAVAIAQLLLERSELTIPLRAELDQFVERPASPWRVEIERYIRRQHCFQLTYQDAAERLWTFTIRYAQIVTYEDRQYLDCWCEETTGNRDLPALSHNWCLRLDRIPEETAIATIKGRWYAGFDALLVELHLLHGLAAAYRTKVNADEVNELLSAQPPVRRVVRRVTNTFWFFREVLRYGEDCVIVSPEEVRDRFKQKVQALSTLYN
jgi:hypothetical protein